MKLTISDYTRLVITLIFLGLFIFLTVTGQELPDIVKDNLTLLIAFYFGIDRVGDIAGKYATVKKDEKEAKKANGVDHVTNP